MTIKREPRYETAGQSDGTPTANVSDDQSGGNGAPGGNARGDASGSNAAPVGNPAASMASKFDFMDSWRQSSARSRARLQFIATYVPGAILLAAGYGGVVVGLQSKRYPILPGIGGGLVVVGLVLCGVAQFRIRSARIRYQEQQELVSRGQVDNAIEDLKADMSYPSLLRLNQTQMDQYHDITKHQAEDSYRNCQIAMAVGLLILVGGATGSIIVKDPTSKVVLGSMTALGSTFSTYIGATFLRAYHIALEQLNYYFGQPLINSYLLSAERLADNMSEGRRDDIRQQIVAGMLQGAFFRPSAKRSNGKSRNKSGKSGTAAGGIQHDSARG